MTSIIAFFSGSVLHFSLLSGAVTRSVCLVSNHLPLNLILLSAFSHHIFPLFLCHSFLPLSIIFSSPACSVSPSPPQIWVSPPQSKPPSHLLLPSVFSLCFHSAVATCAPSTAHSRSTTLPACSSFCISSRLEALGRDSAPLKAICQLIRQGCNTGNDHRHRHSPESGYGHLTAIQSASFFHTVCSWTQLPLFICRHLVEDARDGLWFRTRVRWIDLGRANSSSTHFVLTSLHSPPSFLSTPQQQSITHTNTVSVSTLLRNHVSRDKEVWNCSMLWEPNQCSCVNPGFWSQKPARTAFPL